MSKKSDISIRLGDSAERLKEIKDNSIDLILTDPPYALTSIVKRFGDPDAAKAKFYKDGLFQRLTKGFAGEIWDGQLPSPEIWKECLRVLKSGSFAFIFMTPRQDSLWRILKDLDEVGFEIGFTSLYHVYAEGMPKCLNLSKEYQKSEKDEKFKGWYSFNPKPAVEIILVARKPLKYSSHLEQAKNISETLNSGCVNFDDCRIPYQNPKELWTVNGKEPGWFCKNTMKRKADQRGRFPANVLVSDQAISKFKYFDLNNWMNDKILKEFPIFSIQKAKPSEKSIGIMNGKDNFHPTVKSLELICYLLMLGSRENDWILDPFLGSGTTAIGCYFLDRNCIGIEKEKKYFNLSLERINNLKKIEIEKRRKYERIRNLEKQSQLPRAKPVS